MKCVMSSPEPEPTSAVPGAVLRQVLKEKGMKQTELAHRTGLSAKHINQLCQGDVRISFRVAYLLGMATHTPSSKWNALEAAYQTTLLTASGFTAPLVDDLRESVNHLPPVQYLIMEVLAARYRLGAHSWPFPTRMRNSLRALESYDFVTVHSDTMQGYLRAELTKLGRDSVVDPTYTVPSNDEHPWRHSRAPSRQSEAEI